MTKALEKITELEKQLAELHKIIMRKEARDEFKDYKISEMMKENAQLRIQVDQLKSGSTACTKMQAEAWSEVFYLVAKLAGDGFLEGRSGKDAVLHQIKEFATQAKEKSVSLETRREAENWKKVIAALATVRPNWWVHHTSDPGQAAATQIRKIDENRDYLAERMCDIEKTMNEAFPNWRQEAGSFYGALNRTITLMGKERHEMKNKLAKIQEITK